MIENSDADQIERLNSRVVELLRERDALVKALESLSNQCGNVIYNCEQKPAENQRHLDSWKSVKEFADAALASIKVQS